MVTPFGPDGALDLDAAATLARHLAATGSEGLVVAGTTGEGPVLTDAERLDLFRAVVEAVDVPVIAATGTNDTAHSVVLTREAKAVRRRRRPGRDPVLQPSLAGRAVGPLPGRGRGHRLPVVLYDIPVRSGRRIGPDLTSRWPARCPTSSAVKDATGDVARAARGGGRGPDGFEVYCGDDSLTLPFASVGGVGVDQRGRPLGRPAVRRACSPPRRRRRRPGRRPSTAA